MELLFDIDSYLDWYDKTLIASYKAQKKDRILGNLAILMQKDFPNNKADYNRNKARFDRLNRKFDGYIYGSNEWLTLDTNQWQMVDNCNERNEHNYNLDTKLMVAKTDKKAHETIITNHIKKLQALEITFIDCYKKPSVIPLLHYSGKHKETYKGLDFGYIVEQTFWAFLHDIWIIRGLDYANQLLEDLAENQFSEIGVKLKWVGKPSQLGFIISELVQKGYIEAPIKTNGEINYNELSRTIKDTVNIDSTALTLAKALNPDSESGQISATNKAKFTIPHIKEIS